MILISEGGLAIDDKPRDALIIYQYQKESFARGHHFGSSAINFDGAHRKKKSPPGTGVRLPLFVEVDISTSITHLHVIEAIQKFMECGGCAFGPCILAQSPTAVKDGGGAMAGTGTERRSS